MVTEKQPSPTEEARWGLREQLGMKTQKEGEIQGRTCFTWKILSSFQVFFLLCIHQKRLCSAAGKSDRQISHIHTYTHTHRQMHTYTHTHIQTHTHSSQPTVVSGQWDSSMCTLWNIQLLGQKRERLENHTWASHASTQRWPRWHHPRFIAQNESLRTGNTAVWWAPLSIHILQWNSWEQCCQVFSHWRSFWGSALCRDWMWSYPPWVGLEGISYFHPLACVSPTPYSTSVCAKWD